MALIISSNAGVIMLGDGEDAILLPGVVVLQIRSNDSYHYADIMGTIAASGGVALWLGDYGTETGNAGLIRATGSVSGAYGVFLNGSNGNLVNYGSIYGETSGVSLNSFSAGLGVIRNFGAITGRLQAIEYYFGNLQDTLLENLGTIVGLGTSSVALNSYGTSRDTIHNRGSMHGNVLTGTLDDIVVNTGGLIMGNVELGTGLDRFDNRGGEVTGSVLGGDGHDTFLPGAGEESFDGGADVDTLDFRSTGGLTVALDGSRDNTGPAQGDTYLNVENLLGSTTGADVLIGNAAANRIVGGGGNDLIDGAAGRDRLEGGRGVDTLTGGAGNDTFVYRSLLDAGDVIRDFASAVTVNDDRFDIDAAAFGGGLIAGALAASQFRNRTDNVAQDGDDRFIFRTTDRTLWFDVDGDGAGAAVMLADLQTGAVVTAADILLT